MSSPIATTSTVAEDIVFETILNAANFQKRSRTGEVPWCWSVLANGRPPNLSSCIRGDGWGSRRWMKRSADQSSGLVGLDWNLSFLLSRFSAFRDMNGEKPIFGVSAYFFVINAIRQFDRAFEAAIMPLGKHEAFAFFFVAFGFFTR